VFSPTVMLVSTGVTVSDGAAARTTPALAKVDAITVADSRHAIRTRRMRISPCFAAGQSAEPVAAGR
jgi:hypothetical protein